MRKPSDLMVILDSDGESLEVLREVAERLGCEHVEIDSASDMQQVLGLRHPTMAIMPVDRIDARGMAALDALAHHDSRPAMLLIGEISPRILAGIKRAAATRGLTLIGVAPRPLDAIFVEKMLSPHLAVSPPIHRQEVEQAILQHELNLLYLPKLAMASGPVTIQGVEALVRWQHPRRGLLEPAHFLRAVEEHGLMTQLTDFVMTESVRQGAVWRERGLALEIVVNMSTELVRDRAFPARLASLLEEHNFPTQALTLDVTESGSVADRDLLLDVFTRLRMLGVGLSLDNFGTGLSSLTEIYRIPFSEVKVDHSLLADAPREREARIVVQSIVNLAHTLQLVVCAEGVETSQMYEFVRSAGFDTAQGRFFSEPVDAADIERLVQAWPSSGPAATGSWRTPKSVQFDSATTTLRALRIAPREGKTAP
jgi:EAL domain-containing protein (putative c-di-GMP-specific phosphodiesterase class I)